MLAEHFLIATARARTHTALDETSRQLWRAHAEAQIPDAEAGAISEAIEARRAALAGKGQAKPLRPSLGLPGPVRRLENRRPERRERMFGLGRPRALDRNAKIRIMHWARCLARRTEKGRAYGVVTAKSLAVLEALLWAFHNAKNGLCFPSYEMIAAAAGCARSTVAEAIRALEEAGVMSWVHRIKRVRVACPDLFGGEGSRLVPQRTSNAYHFNDPGGAGASVNLNKESASAPKSEKPTGTANQAFFPLLEVAYGDERTGRDRPEESFAMS
jgi:hypothetical protein